MRDRSREPRAIAFCILLLAAAVPATAQSHETEIRNHFEADAPMRPPGFFDFAVIGARGLAEWMVMADSNPPSPPNQVTQIIQDRPADSLAVAIRRCAPFVDGRLSIFVKRASGRGGILFRMADEKDFLVLMVDAAGDARLVSYRNGKPTELAKGQAELKQDWNSLEISAAGPDVRATWAGKPLLEGRDPSPAAGRAGMVTAGPGAVSFDEFILQPAPERPAPPK